VPGKVQYRTERVTFARAAGDLLSCHLAVGGFSAGHHQVRVPRFPDQVRDALHEGVESGALYCRSPYSMSAGSIRIRAPLARGRS
jgi:hypothetical protein